jgi:hypothetical protein
MTGQLHQSPSVLGRLVFDIGHIEHTVVGAVLDRVAC